MNCIRIWIAGRQSDDWRRLKLGSVTGWGGWRAGQWWSRLWSRLSALVTWRCTCSFASPACLRILCGATLAGKVAGRLVWTKHCWVFCIAAFTFLCQGNSTPRFFSSQTTAHGFSLRYFVSAIAARQKPSLAILAIFNARRMSDCSSCTWPPRLAIVADMLKTYKTLVAVSNNEIQLIPLPYTLR